VNSTLLLQSSKYLSKVKTDYKKMMEMQIIQVEGKNIAEIISDKIIIGETQEALDLMADAGWQGAEGLILNAANFTPAFFDLKTGIAGDILQKF
jgi:hypothetical protein